MLAEGRLRVPQDPREARLVAGLGPGALADRAVADLLDEAREPVLGLAAVREAAPSEVLDSLSTSVRARLWFRNGDSSCTGAGAGVALIRAIFSPMRITMVASSATSPFLNEAVTCFPPGSLK